VHVGDVLVTLPPALFVGRPLPTKGARWQCLVDKALRQDATGNTFSTLTVHCNDGETTISAAASCTIGGRDAERLGFELDERTTNLKNVIRAECEDGF
jgi:hypothetical protein